MERRLARIFIGPFCAFCVDINSPNHDTLVVRARDQYRLLLFGVFVNALNRSAVLHRPIYDAMRPFLSPFSQCTICSIPTCEYPRTYHCRWRSLCSCALCGWGSTPSILYRCRSSLLTLFCSELSYNHPLQCRVIGSPAPLSRIVRHCRSKKN